MGVWEMFSNACVSLHGLLVKNYVIGGAWTSQSTAKMAQRWKRTLEKKTSRRWYESGVGFVTQSSQHPLWPAHECAQVFLSLDMQEKPYCTNRVRHAATHTGTRGKNFIKEKHPLMENWKGRYGNKGHALDNCLRAKKKSKERTESTVPSRLSPLSWV